MKQIFDRLATASVEDTANLFGTTTHESSQFVNWIAEITPGIVEELRDEIETLEDDIGNLDDEKDDLQQKIYKLTDRAEYAEREAQDLRQERDSLLEELKNKESLQFEQVVQNFPEFRPNPTLNQFRFAELKAIATEYGMKIGKTTKAQLCDRIARWRGTDRNLWCDIDSTIVESQDSTSVESAKTETSTEQPETLVKTELQPDRPCYTVVENSPNVETIFHVRRSYRKPDYVIKLQNQKIARQKPSTLVLSAILRTLKLSLYFFMQLVSILPSCLYEAKRIISEEILCPIVRVDLTTTPILSHSKVVATSFYRNGRAI